MVGFTGTFEGAPISVQSTGMGCPSSGIVFEELVQLGVRRLIRVGTCGAIGDGVGFGDVVIALSASCDDTTPLRYAGMPAYSPTATFALAESAARASRELGATAHVGPIVTSGVFYDPDASAISRWRRTGHLAIEMEAAMLYTIAAVARVEALAMMTVSDLVGEGTSERVDDEALRRNVDMLLRVACRVAVQS
jgi:DeoD family purine-nucleoside phosphorylase